MSLVRLEKHFWKLQRLSLFSGGEICHEGKHLAGDGENDLHPSYVLECRMWQRSSAMALFPQHHQ